MDNGFKIKTPDFLVGGGEMGERIRNFDWASTSLGNPQNWEQSLKTCVRIMLSSTQPIWIGWGKELIKLYNDPYKSIVRGKHPGALGQPASVVWSDIWKDIEPMLDKVMQQDKGTYNESQLLIMERSGYPEETYYTFSYTPVLGNTGKPAGMICFNTDDTERILGERQLRTLRELSNIKALDKSEEELYKDVTAALGKNNKDFPFVLVYLIDDKKGIARLVKGAPDYKTMAAPNEIDISKPAEEAMNLFAAVKSGQMILSENNGRRKNIPLGGWDKETNNFLHVPITPAGYQQPLAHLCLGLNPYRKFDAAFEQFVRLIVDQVSIHHSNILAVEQERRRTEELAELDRAKTIFFSNISHEFRTPLTLLLGPLEDIMNDKSTLPQTQNNAQVAHRNAIRLLKLVNTLLEFSRIESGKQGAVFARTDLPAFTKSLVENFRSVTERAGIKLSMSISGDAASVYVDRQMWEKIVFNLLSNAFKYTLNGSIHVKLSFNKTRAILEVEDTGVGIPANELPHMFERFHRVQNVAGRTYEGSGIGLSLIRELVLLHGGDITVQSTEGRGSTFTVSIPLGKTHLHGKEVIEEEKEFEIANSEVFLQEARSLFVGLADKEDLNQEGSTSKTDGAPILIVDDNADMRDLIKTILKRQFRVSVAANGREALDKIKAERPQLVISDVMMPEMDGIELLKHIKMDKTLTNVPVILLTARAGEESLIEGYETGADDYLVKPFSARELVARVTAQVTMAERRRQIELELEARVKERTLQLERSNQELESFNYIASHDLQEPLRKIQTFIHLLNENKGNEAIWDKYYGRITESSRQMSELIQGVLDYTRLSNGSGNFKPTDLNKIMQDVMADFEVLIAEKQVTISYDALPVIPAIGIQIKQLFSNLLSNSIKFSELRPVINITSRMVSGSSINLPTDALPSSGFVELKFSDNGIGFEPQFQEKIFKLFQRLHGKGEYSGTGIGLAIVNKIVARHNGFIRADSQPGKGATFTIWLPA